MKLLLTSGGITNETLRNTLQELVGEDIRAVFIPTAANVEVCDKSWLVNNLQQISELGYMDVVDIAAMPKEDWLPRMKDANLIVMGGGHTDYLMNWIRKSGLEEELPSLLKDKVYMGISAGSMITSKHFWIGAELLYDEESDENLKGLGLIDFYIFPHYLSSDFPELTDENIAETVKEYSDIQFYALDDETAIRVVDGEMEVVSEGKWKCYN